jgi:Na+-driven multidrug efflux pump
MIFSLSSAASVAFIVSLGATAAVATLIGYTLGENSVSPSN